MIAVKIENKNYELVIDFVEIQKEARSKYTDEELLKRDTFEYEYLLMREKYINSIIHINTNNEIKENISSEANKDSIHF